jgi:hypothetical protein
MEENKTLVKLGKLNRYEALCALFNNAKTQGLGALHYVPSHFLSLEKAQLRLNKSSYVDYLEGRVIKVNFIKGAEELDCTLYDRDNGEGSAEKAIREYELIVQGYGKENLYIPYKYGDSECKIFLINNETYWEYAILGGTLSVHTTLDYMCGKVITIFDFTLPIKNSDKYITTKQYVYPDTKVGEVEFNELARNVIIKAVDSLLKGDKEK